MGIPFYFSHVVKSHGQIIKKYQTLGCRANSLFLDSNSIVYDSVAGLKGFYKNVNFEKMLIERVCKKIEFYVREISPTDIAFDGVAPVAKLEQQRGRRYKSLLEKEVFAEVLGKKDDRWDTTAITPGTAFMDKLNKKIGKHFLGKESKYKVREIVFSGSDVCGEGEHKIFSYIREHIFEHKSQITLVYGLDADLIMLCLIGN